MSSVPEIRATPSIDLYPLPDLFQAIREKVDDAFMELEEEGAKLNPSAIVDEEIERLFGPSPSLEWPEYLAGLARLIRVTEQQAQNEAALAIPHEQAALYHRTRAERYQKTAMAYRRKTVEKLGVVGGKFSDGVVRMYLRRTSRVVVRGTCASHDGVHFEQPDCQHFQVDRAIPEQFLKITVEPRKALLRLAINEGAEFGEFARLVDGDPTVVIS